MSLLSLIAALLLEQLHPLSSRKYLLTWLGGYAQYFRDRFDAGERSHGRIAWLLAVLLPLLLIWAVYSNAAGDFGAALTHDAHRIHPVGAEPEGPEEPRRRNFPIDFPISGAVLHLQLIAFGRDAGKLGRAAAQLLVEVGAVDSCAQRERSWLFRAEPGVARGDVAGEPHPRPSQDRLTGFGGVFLLNLRKQPRGKGANRDQRKPSRHLPPRG
jgi:hypothetical protein